ncbi:SusC/RagA family TonB-linked outer membrane protein [Chitinophaga qingshengii]|uniref:SusC/RagA family TonB-linked outer membrane protein n=1 Tax=Chitinophaga qingshengii TaxID=1569794 RepID=A0ABR7TUM5_9BACT|nr:SusC/RagA family TonB-linked outer membrane protein [Chitinophaga qingshengii]MBC9934192.1 SusC/RagA family TonB-linked outer membrane protein [Chitinophaga qingshengii]
MEVNYTNAHTGKTSYKTLFILLLMTTLLHLSQVLRAQTVTVKGTKLSLERVLTDVEKQTGYTIVANYELIKKAAPVSITADKMPLERFLATVLKEQGLDYFIRSKTITITLKGTDYPPASGPAVVTSVPDVTGVITDSTGKPLPGATVAVVGKAGFAPTDNNGRFKIQAAAGETLAATFVGYQPVQVKITSANQPIEVRMKPVVSQLNEYVVEVNTGYQKLKKTQLTGAFATVDRKSYLQSVPVTGNIVENMEGRISGLVLNTNQTGVTDPNNASPFTIRGVSTFQAVKKPLIVLNGYPTEISIESLNPYEIESITVLKDAAAAAIYGVRASNGVVVINTLKGVDSKPQFHLTAAMSVKPRPDYNKLNLETGKGFVDFEVARATNTMKLDGAMSRKKIDAANGTYTPVYGIADDLYNGLITKEQADKLLETYASYDNTADYKRLFLQNQLLRTIDFSVNGGNRQANYFLGFNRVDNQRGQRYSAFDKTSINYRGAFEFMKIFTLDVQSVFSTINDKSVPIPEYTSFRPYQHFLDDAGNPLSAMLSPSDPNILGFGGQYGTISAKRNADNIAMGLYDNLYYPYQEMFESSNHLKQNIYRLQGNLRARVMPGLQLELGGVYERQQGTLTNWSSENAYQTRLMLNYFAARNPNSSKPLFRIPQGGINKVTESLINTYTIRAQASYNKLLNDRHDLSFLLGGEARRLTTSSRLNTAFGYDGNTLSIKPVDLTLIGNRALTADYGNVLAPTFAYPYDFSQFNQYFNETWQDDRFISGYANGAYTYDERYTVTGSLRIDQSNLFGNDPRFRYTPLWSGGVSWNMHREKFIAQLSWIDELKWRASAGYNGNIIKLSGPYTILGAFINTMTPNTMVGYSIKTLRNNQLRWEKTLNYNIGLDFALWQRRVYGSVDYYIKKGTDIFSALAIDATKGAANALVNNASIRNRGLDINLNSINIQNKNFRWQTQVTGSFNNSEVLKVANQFDGSYNYARTALPENMVGYPISAVFGHNYLGLNEKGQPTVQGEDGKPVVLSNSPRVDIPFSALKYMGVNDPRYVLGLNNRFDIGQVNFSFLLMYYGGNIARIAPPIVGDERPQAGIHNYWKKPGDEQYTMIPGMSPPYGTPGYFTVRYGYEYAQQYYRKMDFIVLRNITLGWDIGEKLAKRMRLISPRLAMQVQNPFKYVFSGNDVDPETMNYVTGNRGLPIVPAYTFSLNVNF